MQKNIINIFLIFLSMTVIVNGAIILLCPQISNIQLKNQPSSCDSAQYTTIRIGGQPASIDVTNNQRQYYSRGELVRSQLDNLKKNRFTINNKQSDGRGINGMTIAFIEDRKVQKLSSTADQPRMSIIDSNQNTMNKMLQQLVTCNNQDKSAANYLQNQKNTFNHHQKNIVINTGAYNYQKQQNTPTAQQIHASTLQSSQSQPIQKRYPVSGIKLNSYDWQAIRTSFMQNHRDRIINSVRNKANSNNQQQINQGHQISQNNPSLIQHSMIKDPSQTYLYPGSMTEQNRRSIIQDSSGNRKRRTDNLNLKYWPVRKKQIIPRPNKHQLLIGSNQSPFARFMGPSLSVAPGAAPLNRPRPHQLTGFSNSMSWPM